MIDHIIFFVIIVNINIVMGAAESIPSKSSLSVQRPKDPYHKDGNRRSCFHPASLLNVGQQKHGNNQTNVQKHSFSLSNLNACRAYKAPAAAAKK